MKKKKYMLIISLLILGILASSLLSLNLGVISISPMEVWNTIIGQGTKQQELVLFDFRLPGIVLALLIGMGLSVSGSVLQSITQNELAEPGIIGINAGAGFFIVLFIYFFSKKSSQSILVYLFLACRFLRYLVLSLQQSSFIYYPGVKE